MSQTIGKHVWLPVLCTLRNEGRSNIERCPFLVFQTSVLIKWRRTKDFSEALVQKSSLRLLSMDLACFSLYKTTFALCLSFKSVLQSNFILVLMECAL